MSPTACTATDRSEAVVSFAVTATALSLTPPPLLLPGLDPERRYLVERLRLPGERGGLGRTQPAWCTDGATLTGAALATRRHPTAGDAPRVGDPDPSHELIRQTVSMPGTEPAPSPTSGNHTPTVVSTDAADTGQRRC